MNHLFSASLSATPLEPDSRLSASLLSRIVGSLDKGCRGSGHAAQSLAVVVSGVKPVYSQENELLKVGFRGRSYILLHRVCMTRVIRFYSTMSDYTTRVESYIVVQ